jgi:hypothetical protein
MYWHGASCPASNHWAHRGESAAYAGSYSRSSRRKTRLHRISWQWARPLISIAGAGTQDLMAASRPLLSYCQRLVLYCLVVIQMLMCFFPVSMEYCFHKMLPKLGGPRCRWVGGHPLEFVHIWIKNVWIMWIFVVCAPSQMFRPRSLGPPLCPKGHFLAVRIGGWSICNFFFFDMDMYFFCKKNHRSINDHQQRYKEQQR